MKSGVLFEQVDSFTLNSYRLRTCQLQRNVEVHGNDRAHVYVLGVDGETCAPGGNVIRVEWDVRNNKSARFVGRHRACKTTDRIVKFDNRIRHYRSGGIKYGPCY